MQRITIIATVLIAGVALGALIAADEPAAPAQPAAAEAPKPPKEKGWWNDEASRLIFHAVLEGLYEDGVSQEIVDAVIPLRNTVPTERNPRPVGHRSMVESFVYQCPACHPAYEAFKLYADRHRFEGQKTGDISSFGDGLPEKLRKRLLSDDSPTRRKAVEELIDRWVERRLTLMRLNKEEKFTWAARLKQLRAEGTEMLKNFQGRGQGDYFGKVYADWKSCPTCEGSFGACKLNSEPEKASPKNE